MSELSMDTLLANVDNLPSLPGVVAELIRSLEKEAVSVDELVEGIASDQALAARVLRVANSPFYGIQQRVAHIHDAIVVLGFQAVGSLVLAASITGYFVPPQGSGIDPAVFWRHGIGTGLCARALAHKCGLDAETGFTAGLLHDIGQLLLVTRHPRQYAEVLAWRDANDCPMRDAERSVLGFDHAQAGEMVTRRWRFPPGIVQAVAHHHEPGRAETPGYADLAHVADALAHAMNLARDARALVPPIDAAAWRRLALDESTLAGLLPGIAREHESYCALLSN